MPLTSENTKECLCSQYKKYKNVYSEIPDWAQSENKLYFFCIREHIYCQFVNLCEYLTNFLKNFKIENFTQNIQKINEIDNEKQKYHMDYSINEKYNTSLSFKEHVKSKEVKTNVN